MAQAIKQSRKKTAEQVEETKRQRHTLEGLYRKELGLRAPAEYWKAKRIKNSLWSAGFFGVFLIELIAIGFTVHWLFSQTQLGDLAFWSTADLGVVALTTVTIGVVVALLRVPLRLGMSELHLRNDADERVTMVKTYLALFSEGQAEAKQMDIVLERLFRPGLDGIVKDDIGPVTLSDAITRLASGRG